MIRLFFLLAVATIFIDVSPPSWSILRIPKKCLSPILNRVGLWQGQWSMFTPNPVLNNAYLTAEMEDRVGAITYWDSPDWKRVGSIEKFYRFRELNFYNRIYLDENASAIADFADYLRRTEGFGSLRRLKLTHNPLTMVSPEENPFPSREETIWISSSNFLTEKQYDP